MVFCEDCIGQGSTLSTEIYMTSFYIWAYIKVPSIVTALTAHQIYTAFVNEQK